MPGDGSCREIIQRSLERVESWVESHHYSAYEPFDGLSSRLRPLTLDNHFAERILQQIVKRSPVNIRPFIGVKIQDSTKGRGYMAWGHLFLYRQTLQKIHLKKASDLLSWLDQNKSPFYQNHGWGNHFDFSGRSIRLAKFEPIIVWTSLIGQAYLDAYEVTGNSKFLDVSRSICRWILNLPRERTPEGDCLSYVAFEQISIHNSNMLGAAMLARTGVHCRNKTLLEVARSAFDYSCARQLENGAWYYAESQNCHWIDNFHTGYNLDSLKGYRDSTGDSRYDGALAKGIDFYIRNFFKEDGTPKYFHDRVYPIDIQCAAQAIDTLSTCQSSDPRSLELAKKVALWTIERMQAPDGHFYYSKSPLFLNKTPMLHWGQATMFKALANLLLKI